MKKIIFLFTFFIAFQVGFSQEEKDIELLTRQEILSMSYDELLELPLDKLVILANKLGISVDELLEMKTTISSKKPLTTRESPGIITVITEEEILNSGARDFIDVLRLVPSFFIGYDMSSVLGLGIRGNWGHEGKISLQIDGIEMNEILFATLQMGNHFSVDQIKRIEIIRGPGSAIYGGYAELGVINIITKQAADLNGAFVTGTYGRFNDILARQNITAGAGKNDENYSFSILWHEGKGNLTNQKHQLFYSINDSLPPINNDPEISKYAATNSSNVNAFFRWKKTEMRLLYDNYFTRSADTYYDGITYLKQFLTYGVEVKQNISLSQKFNITPHLQYKRQYGWYTIDTPNYYKKFAERSTAGFGASYEFNPIFNLTGGAEIYIDRGKNDDTASDGRIFGNKKKEIFFRNYIFYLEGLFKLKIFNITAGMRYDKHNQFGEAFSPRLGITGIYKKFHTKLLYSNSFRSPSIENYDTINLNTLKPEKTEVIELELGYQINSNMFVVANLFDIIIHDPLIYFANKESGGYTNFIKTGSIGAELEFRAKYGWGYVTANYSFYKADSRNQVIDYKVFINGKENKDILLGAPQHQATLNQCFYLTSDVSFNTSLIWNSEKYGYLYNDSTVEKLNSVFYVNTFLNINQFIFKDFSLGIGVYNLLHERMCFVQPYKGALPPLPGQGIEYFFKISYSFNSER